MVCFNSKDFAEFVLNAFHREWLWAADEEGYGRYGRPEPGYQDRKAEDEMEIDLERLICGM